VTASSGRTGPRQHTEGTALARFTALYLRVSTRSQDTASQEPDLKRWAEEHKDQPARWYRDRFTGKTMDRPGFGKLMDDLGAGKVERVVVWRLDRLGRTAKGLTALFEDLLARKVDLVSLKDGLDLETPAGRLMAHVLASVAAYGTEVRAERIYAGQAAAREAGKTWGGGRGRARRRENEGPGPTRGLASLLGGQHAPGRGGTRVAPRGRRSSR